MENLRLIVFLLISTAVCKLITVDEDDAIRNTTRERFSFKKSFDSDNFSSSAALTKEGNIYKNALNMHNGSINTQKNFIRVSDTKTMSRVPSLKLNDFRYKTQYDNFTARKDTTKKIDHSFTWPTWSSKKEIYQNNRNRKKNRKHIDSFEDYLGLDSKYHEMADRKYIHEHEGFFFPIHVPSHHEKDDHLIPLLLLLLLPLLLFAIIIPLNANLLSTLFLIMQNNGATSAAAQLAAASGRRKRQLYNSSHPELEKRLMEALHTIRTMPDDF